MGYLMVFLLVLFQMAPTLALVAISVAATRAANEYVRRGRPATPPAKPVLKKLSEVLTVLFSK